MFTAASCVNDAENNGFIELLPGSQQCKVEVLNPEKGYIVNQSTGDSIIPLTNHLGKVVVTGVPIEIIGKKIQISSIVESKSKPPKIVKKVDANVTIIEHKLIEKRTTFNRIEDSNRTLKTSNLFTLIGGKGDTIPTGVPFSIRGEKKLIKQPQPVKTLPWTFKDNAMSNIQYLDVEQGMAASYIWILFEDSRKNIWFGDHLGGVSCYDGVSLIHFSEKEGLCDNSVRTILEDKKGNIWFGTNSGGVSCYNGREFINYTERLGLPDNRIRAMLEDKDGNIWISAWGAGVSKLTISDNPKNDSLTITQFTTKEGLSDNHVLAMVEDEQGKIWFGTYGGGVNCYDPTNIQTEKFKHFTEKEGLCSNLVMSMQLDSKDNLWVGTHGGGLSKITFQDTDELGVINYTSKDGLANDIIMSIAEDDQGDMWFGTYGDGVSKLEETNFKEHQKDKFIQYSIDHGLSSNRVMSVLADSEGNMWFGTSGAGISKLVLNGVKAYNGSSFRHFSSKVGLDYYPIMSMSEDRKGNIWFGTHEDGIIKYDGENFIQLSTGEDFKGEIVYSTLEDTRGRMWFGTWGGIYIYDGKTFKTFRTNDGDGTDIIQTIIEDQKGDIWFGTLEGGLIHYNSSTETKTKTGTITHFTEKEGFSNNSVLTIYETRNGDLWFGTDGGGVSRYDGKFFTHFTEKEGLGNNGVTSIYEDDNGNIWLGTNGGGINKLSFEKNSNNEHTNHGTVTYIGVEQGLSHNIVTSIQKDNNNSLWFGTMSGLNQLIFDEKEGGNEQKFNIQSYDKTDGLKGLSFFSNAVFLDSKERMWWGTGKSLTMLDMHQLSKSKPKTKSTVELKWIEINEHFVDCYHLSDSLFNNDIQFDSVKRFSNYPINLKVPYSKNHLTFHFSTINWSAPHKVMYSYIIEGLNDNWSVPSKENKADYRNIPSGSYTFKVRHLVEGEPWSEPFLYTFIIKTPWWYSWLAYIFYTIILIGIVILIIKSRTTKHRKLRLRLEQEVRIATKEIREQKEELKKTMLSKEEKEILLKEIHHRVKNNLQIINSLIRLQTDFTNESNYVEKSKETENRIKSMALIHEMLYKSDDLASLNVTKYIEELNENILNSYSNNLEINFSFDLAEAELGVDTLIPLGLIINEVFSNSIRYAFADNKKGSISIELFNKGNFTYLNIWDNGIGTEESIDDLRENSLGMDLIWSLAAQLDGEIELNTSNGFRYEFNFPKLF